MALKNSYSSMPIQNIFNALQKSLVSHGARQLIYDYRPDGKIGGLAFVLETKQGGLPIKVPARIEGVAKKLEEQGFRYNDDQVYRVAWRNILDWVASQLALVDIEMVQMDEVFLPYMTDQTGRTLFERFNEGTLLLGGGDETK